MSVITRTLFALGLPVVLIAVWWVVSTTIPSFYFPPLPDIIATFPETWFTGRIGTDVVPSLSRFLAGYGIALALGILLGVPLGLWVRVREVFEPVLEFFRALPPSVMVPVIMLFAGIGTEMKVIIIASGCMWPILLNTIEGIRGVDDVLIDTARSYRMRPGSRVWRLQLRAASPQIFTGARQSLSIGLILMVISEMFAPTDGLGYAIVQFQRHFDLPEMWSGVILLSIIGFALAMLFRVIENRSLTWYRGHKRDNDVSARTNGA